MNKRKKPSQSIFTYYDKESSIATEFRRLAKNIRRSGNPSETKSIMITSASKGEGKSLISANLAVAIAKREEDKNVLLIDFDLRRSTIHSFFEMRRDPGLTSMLKGDSELNDVLRDTRLKNLKVITSGRISSSPTQLLENIGNTLGKCKNLFDVIICDTPPVVPVDDALMLIPHLDGVLFVVMAGKTDRMVIKRAMDMLNDNNANILGIAVNNLHAVLPYYYNYGYYRYGYGDRNSSKEA